MCLVEAEVDTDVHEDSGGMDSAKWRMYGRTSTTGVLGMSCDECGARVGEGLQC